MKNHLLVTLADKNYIDQAKQLFSSAYWNAGWSGNYMLLAYEIPDASLNWFRNKGILVKKCLPLSNLKMESYFPLVLSKFYLFTPEIKEWDNVIFLDTDIIIRASLEDLTKVKGFSAVEGHSKLSRLFLQRLKITFKKTDKKIFEQCEDIYDFSESSFNTGVMAFGTDVIKEDTFSNLKTLFDKYGPIICSDESILNLYFYKRWVKLPAIYNIDPYSLIRFNNVAPDKVKGIILHFHQHKPWDTKNYFYKEWRDNLERAELIDTNTIRLSLKKWDESDIREYLSHLEKRRIKFFYKYFLWKMAESFLYFIDRHIGLFGLFLKVKCPKLYYLLKKQKGPSRG